jgi:hypothetical protein
MGATRFASITATIARGFALVTMATACSGPVTGRGTEQGSGGSGEGSGGTAPASGGSAGDDASPAGSGGDGAAAGDDAGSEPETGVTTGDAEAPACHDEDGIPGACNLNAADGGCSTLVAYCLKMRDLLKPAVAATLVSCMEGLTECTEPGARGCLKVALFGACNDPSAESACGEAVRACAGTVPVTLEECHNFLDGVIDRGRDQIVSCLNGGDGAPACPSGVWGCITSL